MNRDKKKNGKFKSKSGRGIFRENPSRRRTEKKKAKRRIP